jgi:hypothetical protein
MKLTDYLAAWGAVVATAVAVWNVYKDFLRRDRLKIHARFDLELLYKLDVLVLMITNFTPRPVKITRCGSLPSRTFHWEWMRRLFSSLRAVPSATELNPFSGTIPSVIAPSDSATILYRLDEGVHPFEELFVESSDGNAWFCPRSLIREMHRNNVYQQLL